MKFSLVLLTTTSLCVGSLRAGNFKDKDPELPEDYRESAKILHKICMTESGASEVKLRKCMDGTLHDERGAKCYIHCLFDKVEVIDEATGQILLDRLAPLVPNTDVRKALELLTQECGHITHDDPCETAYEAAKCYVSTQDQVVRFCHLLMMNVTVE